ncbi:MAG: type 1 glutamine amidotransferase [Spirochaetaceae bacterium]|jgi:GMP synthase-like glutamine amidotransferase|nr:type 1 glutamine amidotransferase [Spirochaetaceae bacterium]
MKLLALQHDDYDDAGSIIEWAIRNNHSLDTVLLTKGGKLPSSLDFDILFIMGGTMNVYEEYKFPWLAEEKVFIKKTVDAGKIAIGFCLGGQLLAVALGGKVTGNTELEAGWRIVNFNKTAQEHPVLSVFGKNAVIFQWHSDTFSVLPENALLVASNDACAHHGFIYGNKVYAFQFHLELTYQMAYYFARELEKGGEKGMFVQSGEKIRKQHKHIKTNNKLMFDLLDRLASNNFVK